MLWSRDVRWPASIFPSSHFTFSSSKKLNFLIQSNIRQVPNILVFLSSCTRPTSFAWLSGRTLSLLQLECSREEECLVRAKNFSARNPQLFSFSSLLTEVPKNRSHPRLIQEYFSCLFFFFRWRASILLNCSSMDSFVFFSSSKSPCGNFDYLTGLFAWNDVVELETQEKKFDCDNCSWWKTRKTKRTCWQVWIFITLTRWLSTMMRKDFRLNFSVLSSRRFAWNPEMQSLSFPKKLFVDPKTVSTTLYLFFRGWWQIFVLLNARSQLLEVIFLLVQAEAQYNSDTINNISTVGVVKWGSSIFVLRCKESWRASVTSESWSSSVVSSINFLNKSEFVRCWSCGRLRKRKIRNYFFTSGSPSPILTQTEDVEGMLNASGVTGAGRKVLITQAGQEGPILFFSLFSFSTSTTGRWTDFRC